ncbi:MAG: YhgE/Pip family protein, partial [Atopobiaceae bacterium]|nr:YhgE/Pip family protein [Atopobiaceae bacterium]
MSRILAVIRRDFDHVRGNVIALLVCMGLVIMPSLYAWFNIAGGWDPYANTGGLKVAVANSDEGVQGSILPFRINVGERVVSNLAGSEKIGYVITSEDDAIDGVYSGEYYAAVVIPADFSTNLLSVFSKSPNHPQLLYYVNEKRNPIASIVTGKASTSIQTMINEDLSATVSQTTTDIMDELGGVLDDDSLLSVASRLNSVVEDSLGALRSSATNITAYQGVITSIRNVTATSDAMLGNDSLSLDAAGKLSGTADKVRDFDAKIQNAKQS